MNFAKETTTKKAVGGGGKYRDGDSLSTKLTCVVGVSVGVSYLVKVFIGTCAMDG